MVTADKQRIVGHDGVYLIGCVLFGQASVGQFVWVESVWIIVVVYRELPVLQDDALTGERDDSLDDVFFTKPRDVLGILKYDNLATFGNVRFVLELSQGYWQAIHDQTVTRVERLLHARTFDVEAAEDEGVDE